MNLSIHANRNLFTAYITLRAVAFWVALSRESFGGLSWPCHRNVPDAQELKLSQEVRAASFRRLQPLGFLSELIHRAISYNREVMGWGMASHLIVTLLVVFWISAFFFSLHAPVSQSKP